MCDVPSLVLDWPFPVSSSLQYILLSRHTQSTLSSSIRVAEGRTGIEHHLSEFRIQALHCRAPLHLRKAHRQHGLWGEARKQCGHGRQEGGVWERGGQSWPSKGNRGRDTNGRQNGGLIFQAREVVQRTEGSR